MKPGWKTTEFWLSLIAIVLGGAYAVDLIPTDGIWGKLAGLAAVVLGSFGYTVSRGKAKSTMMVLLAATLAFAPGCGMLTGLQTGAQGQAAETGAATASSVPTIWAFNLFGVSKLTVSYDEQGRAVVNAVSEGDTMPAGLTIGGPSIAYGEQANTAEISSGGGSTAGSQPGQGGSVALEIPTPITGTNPVNP